MLLQNRCLNKIVRYFNGIYAAVLNNIIVCLHLYVLNIGFLIQYVGLGTTSIEDVTSKIAVHGKQKIMFLGKLINIWTHIIETKTTKGGIKVTELQLPNEKR